MTGVGSWRIVAASAIGTSHAKVDMPCQDAHTTSILVDSRGEEVLVIVVSDGAGSAARAEIGSQLTCSSILKSAELFLANHGEISDISCTIAHSWIRNAQKAIESRASEEGMTSRDYACTMLVAIIGSDVAVMMQIGDGAIVVSEEDGWRCIHWPQHGEFANTTNFLTEAYAEQRLDHEIYDRRIDEVAVFTDGIERLVLHEASKTVFSPFFDRTFPVVREAQIGGFDKNLSDSLSQYLSAEIINERTDDDKTLVLATRRRSFNSGVTAQSLNRQSEGEGSEP